MAAFSEHDLKAVALEELKQAASMLQMPTYGNKKDIAGRIATCLGGDVVLGKLIKTSAKTKEEKKTKAHSGFVNATKKLPDAVCKMRNLTLVKEDYSKPTPVFQYKINQEHKKGTPTKCVRKTTPGKRIADAFDDEDDEVDFEAVVGRLMRKKVKREHVNGMLEGYGLDASSWSMADAKLVLVEQMLYETDEESDEDN